jgi:hypothetical protein
MGEDGEGRHKTKTKERSREEGVNDACVLPSPGWERTRTLACTASQPVQQQLASTRAPLKRRAPERTWETVEGRGCKKGRKDVGGRTVLYCNHMEPVQLAHPEVPHAEVVP